MSPRVGGAVLPRRFGHSPAYQFQIVCGIAVAILYRSTMIADENAHLERHLIFDGTANRACFARREEVIGMDHALCLVLKLPSDLAESGVCDDAGKDMVLAHARNM